MGAEELLSIDPTELKFPFELKKQISVPFQLLNKTDNYMAFKVKTTNPKKFSVRPNNGVVLPRSTCNAIVTMQAQREAPPDMQSKDRFLVQWVITPPGAAPKDINAEMFNKAAGNNVEESKFRVVYVSPPKPPSPVPEESLEGCSPMASVSDIGHFSTSEPSDVSREHVEVLENSTEDEALFLRLTEEKNQAIQQNNKLRHELVPSSHGGTGSEVPSEVHPRGGLSVPTDSMAEVEHLLTNETTAEHGVLSSGWEDSEERELPAILPSGKSKFYNQEMRLAMEGVGELTRGNSEEERNNERERDGKESGSDEIEGIDSQGGEADKLPEVGGVGSLTFATSEGCDVVDEAVVGDGDNLPFGEASRPRVDLEVSVVHESEVVTGIDEGYTVTCYEDGSVGLKLGEGEEIMLYAAWFKEATKGISTRIWQVLQRHPHTFVTMGRMSHGRRVFVLRSLGLLLDSISIQSSPKIEMEDVEAWLASVDYLKTLGLRVEWLEERFRSLIALLNRRRLRSQVQAKEFEIEEERLRVEELQRALEERRQALGRLEEEGRSLRAELDAWEDSIGSSAYCYLILH